MIGTIFRELKSLLLKMWSGGFLPLLPFVAPFLSLFAFAASVDTAAQTMITTINGLASRIAGYPGSTIIAQANRVVPIAEAMGMLLALLGLRLAVMVVRWVKSLIPTIN